MNKRFFILSLLLVAWVSFTGCAKDGLPSINDPKYAVSQPVDADESGKINEEDVRILEARANDCLNMQIIPVYKKAGIEIETEQDLYEKENIKKLKKIITVEEWEKLIDSFDEWIRLKVQASAIREWLGKNPTITDSGTVIGLLYNPDRLVCKLKDDRAVRLIGIGVPTHASKYRKMCDEKFYRLALNKVAKIEYDVLKSGDNFLFGYLYIDNVFVNAEMVSEGYAWAKPDPPNNRYDNLFIELEKKAKKEKKGIWKLIGDPSDIDKIDDNDSGIMIGLSPDYPDRLICELKDGRFVKLTGISVPTCNSEYRKLSNDKCYKLILNKKVKIRYDRSKYEGDFLLGYIYIGDTFINVEMVSTGYAKAAPTPPNNKYDELFKKLENEAKKNKRGIWAHINEF